MSWMGETALGPQILIFSVLPKATDRGAVCCQPWYIERTSSSIKTNALKMANFALTACPMCFCERKMAEFQKLRISLPNPLISKNMLC
jgi:hypothetical protein